MVIGWCTLNSSQCCHEMQSIGYDGYNRCIVVGDHLRHPISESHPKIKRWQAGDILGCLIDLNTKFFTFYLNASPIEYQHDHNSYDPLGTLSVLVSHQGIEEPAPYFPAASLSAYQQCYFNNGEVPFKYPPRDVAFSDLRSDSGTVYVPT